MRSLIVCVLIATGSFACDQGSAPDKDVATQASPAGDAKVMDECPGAAHGSCGEAAEPGEGQRSFGSFALDESESLAAVAASMGEETKTVQVTGTVESVCQKKGCWMVLKDGDVTARVFTYAGNFFLPTSTEKGRAAVVEGELEARTMSEKFAKHLAEDQGEDASAVTGPRKELVINATAIALK